jgi:hypothetical protein
MLVFFIDQERQKSTGILGVLGNVAKGAKRAAYMLALLNSGYRSKTLAVDMSSYPQLERSEIKNSPYPPVVTKRRSTFQLSIVYA